MFTSDKIRAQGVAERKNQLSSGGLFIQSLVKWDLDIGTDSDG